jgi:rhamnosyl/mannosyltransferase
LGSFSERCRVIHFGIDPSRFTDPPPEAEADLPLRVTGRPLMLFVGRLVYYKGVDVLLRAIARIPEVAVVVAGDGPLRRELEDTTRLLGLGDRAAFVGEVEPLRLAALYHAATALVLPSVERTEMFGMVQLEAMAAGKPVISTDLPTGVPYVNRHRSTGLVVSPGDRIALERAIREISFNPSVSAEMGAAGRARVLEEFTLERQAKRYESLYRELLGMREAAA